jgi:hypothetical protein
MRFEVWQGKFPALFPEYPACGFELPPGWATTVEALCEKLEPLAAATGAKCAQIKEKFGGLRFYLHGGNDEMFSLIHEAESISLKVCERCGALGRLRAGGWVKTLCDTCDAVRARTS